MDCQHMNENVKSNCANPIEDLLATKDLECAECNTKNQIWLCLQCGVANCGRYVHGHAKKHAEKSEHQLCISCEELSVYCYVCDEYTSNDTDNKSIDKIRKILKRYMDSKKYSETQNDEDSNPNSERVSSPSPLSVCDETQDTTKDKPIDDNSPTFPVTVVDDNSSNQSEIDDRLAWKDLKVPEDTVRNLRPRSRKRSHSEENNSGDNSTSSNGSQAHKDKKLSPSPSNGKLHKEKRVVGLRNLGNTCFMNAVLQSLSNIREFSYFFSSMPALEYKNTVRRVYHSRSYTKQQIHEVCMAEELRKVLINLREGVPKGAISPESLFHVIWKVVPSFRGFQQQDAHEFLRYMLDRLHTELVQVSDPSMSTCIAFQLPANQSIVTTLFGGTLQSEVRCLSCGTESKKRDPFLDLSVDIPERFVPKRGGSAPEEASMAAGQPGDARAAAGPPDVCTLADCITSFVELEELADTERYFCKTCSSKQKSTKRFWVQRLPNVLCLHIKRFRWNNYFRTKIDTNIRFPMSALDMSEFTPKEAGGAVSERESNNLYDLAAVIVHHGSGAGSGHYTAFAMNENEWFHFNDSTVRPVDPETVTSCKPYILFYIRRQFLLPPIQDDGQNEQEIAAGS